MVLESVIEAVKCGLGVYCRWTGTGERRTSRVTIDGSSLSHTRRHNKTAE